MFVVVLFVAWFIGIVDSFAVVIVMVVVATVAPPVDVVVGFWLVSVFTSVVC
jgi:hypothetical protein